MSKAAPIAALTVLLAACASAPPHGAVAPPSGGRPSARTQSDGAPPAPGGLEAKIVDGAEAMLGQPYRYGGAAPGGFDCSGLVVYAMNGAGIRVPRTAREQLHTGAPVTRRALRAGDLVFMHLARKDLHVGIAIDGERFVHAPSRGGYVRIDSLAAAPYAQTFVAARRVVGEAARPGAPAVSSGTAGALESRPGSTPVH